MKRAIAIILAILMVATLCFALSGCFRCTGDPNRKTIGDFVFRYTKENTAAHLQELSDRGKEKSVLVIPSHLPNGLPVTSMGSNGGWFGFSEHSILFTDKAVKLFIPNTIEEREGPLPESLEYLVWDCNEKLIWDLYNFIDYYDTVETIIVNSKGYADLYTYIEYYPLKHIKTAQAFETRLLQPNVEFYLNYETENPLFWFDYETGDYIQKHYEGTHTPMREGYAFAGWYTEPECINEWNFDTDKMPEFEVIEPITANLSKSDIPTEGDIDGFYDELFDRIFARAESLERVRLYAKWEKG